SAPERSTSPRSSASSFVKLPSITPLSEIWPLIEGALLILSLRAMASRLPIFAPVQVENFSAPVGLSEKATLYPAPVCADALSVAQFIARDDRSFLNHVPALKW